MPTIRLIIKGKVQGVFYRATAKEVADELGVKGWIRNTEEGNVEIVASGKEDQLQHFISWCGRGPSRAVVTEVVQSELKEAAFDEFRIVRNHLSKG
jgi:acylphosphatase